MYDIAKNGTYPEDVYGPNGLRYYETGDASDHSAYASIRNVDGRPNAPIRIYRAVEKSSTAKITPGDWVTTSRQYAKDHGEGNIPSEYKIIR